MKIQTSSPYNIQCHVVEQFTPVMGGWSNCQPDFLPGLGSTGYTPICCFVGHSWKNSQGQIVIANESQVSLSEIGGYCKGGQSIINAKPNPAQYGVCTLWFYVHLTVEDANGVQTTVTFVFNSGFTQVSPPDQGVANDPVPLPQVGVPFNIYVGLDVNGSNTVYDLEIYKGLAFTQVYSNTQSSNHFVVTLNEVDQYGYGYRTRPRNDQGVGAWSDWCVFMVV